jgi:transcriptional regulator with XRE-family HTH domain
MPHKSVRTGQRVEVPLEDVIGDDRQLAELVQQADDVMAGGRLIKSARLAAGLSQMELARRLDVSQPRVSDMESGLGAEGVSYAIVLRAVRACGFEPSFRFHKRSEDYKPLRGTSGGIGGHFAVFPTLFAELAVEEIEATFEAAMHEVRERIVSVSQDFGEQIKFVEVLEHGNGYEEDVEVSAAAAPVFSREG